MKRLRTKRWIFFALMSASAVALVWFFRIPESFETGAILPQATSPASTPVGAAITRPRWPWQKPQPPPKTVNLVEVVQQESQAMGRTDANPQGTLERLIQVAAQLQPRDFETLMAMALNVSLAGDQRFLAAYLMSLSRQDWAAPLLKVLALTPLPDQKLDARLYDQEVMIRAQALEGLSHSTQGRDHLADFLRHQDNVSLAQHAQRLLRAPAAD